MKALYTILILMTVISCKKDQIQYNITGTVKNEITNSKISQVKLQFYQTELNANVLNPNFVFLGTTTTNSNGEYSFSFDRKKIDKFKITVEHDEYYPIEDLFSSSELSSENENNFSYELESLSWVKIRLKNNFVQMNKSLNFHKYNVQECEECCVNGNLAIPYTIPDTTFICPVIGDVYFRYTYGVVIGNSATSSSTDSVLCIPFDTTSIFIQY